MPSVTIIVPVYNVEKYLDQCIQSLIHQSLKDIEILLFNDGSKDGSPAICDKYAAMDPRITVIHQENQGQCKTRNRAIAYVKSPFLTYVDSDDWIPENACEIMYNAAVENNADLVFGNYVKVTGESRREKRPYSEDRIHFAEKDIRERLFRDVIAPTGTRLQQPQLVDSLLTCSAKLYKTDIIRQNALEWIDRKTIYSDCLDFIIKYVAYCRTAEYVNAPLYFYRRNDASQTAQYRKDIYRLWNYQFDALETLIRAKQWEDAREAYRNRICFSIIPIGGNAIALPTWKEQKEECRIFFESERYRKAFADFSIGKLPFHYRPLFWTAKKNYLNLFLILTHWMRMVMKKVC